MSMEWWSLLFSALAVLISAWAVWYTRKATQLKKESVMMERLRQAPLLDLVTGRNQGPGEDRIMLMNIGGHGVVESIESHGDYDLLLSPSSVTLGSDTRFLVYCPKVIEFSNEIAPKNLSGIIYYFDESGNKYSQRIRIDGPNSQVGIRRVEGQESKIK